MRILAIESSCDETAAAIVENGTTVVSSTIASSTAFHKKYGGIVPEVAAREQVKSMVPVLQEVLGVKSIRGVNGVKGIDAIAVTVGPGLIGSLLVGVETAKTLAFVTKKPIIPVNHVLAHMYANFLVTGDKGQETGKTIQFPAISLVVSGGHTELFLMKDEKTIQWLGGTVDDAAGEAFDKTARLLGFDNGGGPAIQKASERFKIQDSGFKIQLPRPLMYDKSLNFSFSGLKTAILREWKKCHPETFSVIPAKAGIQSSKNMDPRVKPEDDNPNLVRAFAYEVQEAITDVLVAKTVHAAGAYGAKSILVSGGVAANTRLREKFYTAISQQLSAVSLFTPPIELCTDNAAYIGSYAFFRGVTADWHTITATPDLTVEVME